MGVEEQHQTMGTPSILVMASTCTYSSSKDADSAGLTDTVVDGCYETLARAVFAHSSIGSIDSTFRTKFRCAAFSPARSSFSRSDNSLKAKAKLGIII